MELFLLGGTGSGKHEVGFFLAQRLNAEIVSVDSMKVYRGMDIGTAKPPRAWRDAVLHHLIDIVDPWDAYNAGRFVRDAQAAVAKIHARGRRPLFVGGTALYAKAWRHGLFEGAPSDPDLRRRLEERARREGVEALYGELARRDPEGAVRIHPRDLKRIQRALEVLEKTGMPIGRLQTQFRVPPARQDCVVVLRRSDQDLRGRIERRLDRMLEAGFLEEVRRLVDDPRGWSREPARSHGYWELAEHLQGRMTWKQARTSTLRRIWRFTRRQMSWFRSFEGVQWVEVAADEPVAAVVERVLRLYTDSQ